MPTNVKFICIGLPKTGTTSLCKAFECYGYEYIHGPYALAMSSERMQRGVLDRVDLIAEIHGLFDFELLKQWYPDARLIWTTRDIDSWLTSCEGHFKKIRANTVRANLIRTGRMLRFGVDCYSKEVFSPIYNEHYKKVNLYKDRTGEEIIQLDITNGDGYDGLSSILPLTSGKFPHFNKSKSINRSE